jgi:bisphosphoglycerate-independent phosphoglycerate mutase (AlkP superfamily)
MLPSDAKNMGNEGNAPYTIISNDLDIWEPHSSRGAEIVGNNAIKYLGDYQDVDFLAFFHFSNPDHMGHRYGIDSPEYKEAIITCDLWLGKIIGKLKELNIYQQTLIYVTSDHGFDEIPKNLVGRRNGIHNNAPDVFLAANDPLIKAKKGSQLDIAPTILKRFGVDIRNIKPPLPGKSLTED